MPRAAAASDLLPPAASRALTIASRSARSIGLSDSNYMTGQAVLVDGGMLFA